MGRIVRHALAASALACTPSCVPPAIRPAVRPVAQAAPATAPQLPVRLVALIGDVDIVRRVGPAAPVVALRPAIAAAQDRSALQCMTAALYYEARSEGEAGERAVAQVVLNRTRNRAYPSSVCGVIYQRDPARGTCQFTFACDGSERRRLDAAAWAAARTIARRAIGGLAYAPVGAATHYHNDQVDPSWSRGMLPVATIGAHLFYRRPDGVEAARPRAV